ncbi:MAG: hypothetical protein ACC660_08075 [Acidimicrobiales bacterium]
MVRRGPGRGRGRRQVEPPTATAEELNAWFAGNLPDDWFSEPPMVMVDRDEILVTGTLHMPKLGADDDTAVAARARIAAFRENTREDRMTIADRAQNTYLRKVSWAVTCGDEASAFTTASVPVMTRLVMDERVVLDTLIEAGVARSRSEALAWCVQLVGENESEWIGKLRDAMEEMVEVRNAGPDGRG